MTCRIGLTGSIGMGKSTTAQMFADEGVPVWSADAAVHELYRAGQPAAMAVATLFPTAMDGEGGVDRQKLRSLIVADPSVLDQLNAAVHPLVKVDRAAFLAAHNAKDIILLDIPLLFETGSQGECDAVVVVSTSPDEQRRRVRARGMTEAEIDMILSRQMPDAEKRARADHVILTTSLAVARAAVKDILYKVRQGMAKDA